MPLPPAGPAGSSSSHHSGPASSGRRSRATLTLGSEPAGGPLPTASTNASNRPYAFQTRSVAGTPLQRQPNSRLSRWRRASAQQRGPAAAWSTPVTPLVARTPGLRVAAGQPNRRTLNQGWKVRMLAGWGHHKHPAQNLCSLPCLLCGHSWSFFCGESASSTEPCTPWPWCGYATTRQRAPRLPAGGPMARAHARSGGA